MTSKYDMTSKQVVDTFREALDDMNKNHPSHFWGASAYEILDIIEQDLKILDLLKYFIQVEYEKTDDTYWIKLGKYGGILTNKETYEKIKDWLERNSDK